LQAISHVHHGIPLATSGSKATANPAEALKVRGRLLEGDKKMETCWGRTDFIASTR